MGSESKYVPTEREKAFQSTIENPKYERDIINGLTPFFKGTAPEGFKAFYTAEELSALEALKGDRPDALLVTSGKRGTYIAGADVNHIRAVSTPEEGEAAAADREADPQGEIVGSNGAAHHGAASPAQWPSVLGLEAFGRAENARVPRQLGEAGGQPLCRHVGGGGVDGAARTGQSPRAQADQ